MELLNQELLEQDKGTQELLRQVLEGTKIFHFYYYPQKRLEVMPVRTSKYFNCSMEYRNIPESFVEDFVSGESKADCYAMYEAIHNGAKTASSTFCDKNKQCWVRVTMTVMSGMISSSRLLSLVSLRISASKKEWSLKKSSCSLFIILR